MLKFYEYVFGPLFNILLKFFNFNFFVNYVIGLTNLFTRNKNILPGKQTLKHI